MALVAFDEATLNGSARILLALSGLVTTVYLAVLVGLVALSAVRRG